MLKSRLILYIFPLQVWTLSLEGAEKDKVVVIGEGVDAVSLAATMRKKVGHTDIISVAKMKKGN